MWLNPQETVDLVTFTKEILNGKLHFLWHIVYIFKNNWNFLTKFWYSDQMFSRNICAFATHDNFFIRTIYKYLDMVSVGNLHWGYPLKNGDTRWRHECGRMTFPGTSYNVCNFLVEMSTFKQLIKLTSGRNKVSKG